VRFVPVPYLAIDCAGSPGERGAVLDLYERAHSRKWRAIRASHRDLQARWGISARCVCRLLVELEIADCIEVITGDTRRKTAILVFDPTARGSSDTTLDIVAVEAAKVAERLPERLPERSPERSPERYNPGAPVDIEESESQSGTQGGTLRGTQSGTTTEYMRPETRDTETRDSETDSMKVGSATLGTQDFQTVAFGWKEQRPGGPALSPTRGQGKLLASRLKQHDLDSVVAVLKWALHSKHKRAVFLRDNGNATLKTLMRPTNFEEYLEMAREAQEPAPDRGSHTRVPERTPEEEDAIWAAMDACRMEDEPEGGNET